MANRVSGLVSGMDTEQLVTAMVSNYKTKVDKYTKQQTKLDWTQDARKNLNTKVYSLYTNISSLRYSSAYTLQKATASDSTKATVTANGSAVNGTQKLNIISLAQSAYLTGADLSKKYSGTINMDTKLSAFGYKNNTSTSTVTTTDEEGNETTEEKTTVKATSFNVNYKDEDGKEVTKNIKVTEDTSLETILKELRETGLNASFDTNTKRFYISSKVSGSAGDFSITADEGDEYSSKALEALGLNVVEDGDSSVNATMIKGKDAEIKLNGVTYTNTSNAFVINGLTINVTGITGDKDEDAITITTENDTQALYDKIKDFLTEYNNIINEITKLYNAESAGDYKPLTDEEKEQMTETEVEKWEQKIKDSLLRRDTTLNGVQQAMMAAMSGTIVINGAKLSLSSFGIHTMGYLNAAKNEQNAYHIDGDSDDENTSGKEDKLMEALNTDPEQVVDFFKQLTTNLYDAIGDKMKSTTLSSAYTIYNDKQMKKQYAEFSTLIKQWEKKMTDKEDSYYKKFATMEKKLSELQGQTSSLTGLIGSNN